MRRMLLAGAVTLALSPAVARETICDRHTEGGRVYQTCRFVDSPPAPPGATVQMHPEPHPAERPAVAQSPPARPRPAAPPAAAGAYYAPPAYQPPEPDAARLAAPYYAPPACGRQWCGPPGLEPGYLARYFGQ
jgi:hypothetical protein